MGLLKALSLDPIVLCWILKISIYEIKKSTWSQWNLIFHNLRYPKNTFLKWFEAKNQIKFLLNHSSFIITFKSFPLMLNSDTVTDFPINTTSRIFRFLFNNYLRKICSKVKA